MSKVKTAGDHHYGTQQLRIFCVFASFKKRREPRLAMQEPNTLKIRLLHEKLTKGIDLHYGFTGKGIDWVSKTGETRSAIARWDHVSTGTHWLPLMLWVLGLLNFLQTARAAILWVF